MATAPAITVEARGLETERVLSAVVDVNEYFLGSVAGGRASLPLR
jgi:hypothetical protein